MYNNLVIYSKCKFNAFQNIWKHHSKAGYYGEEL
jgi:hypothetical protein